MEKYRTPAELLVEAFQTPGWQNRMCILDDETCRAFSYGEMEEETAHAAGLLRSFHLNAGDTVSLLLENGLHFFIPWLGAMRIGAKVHPINCLYTPEQVAYALELCETKLLVLQERYSWDKTKNKPSPLLELLLKKFPGIKIVIMHDPSRFDSREDCAGRGYPGTISWNVLKKFVKPYRHIVHRYLKDPFQLICTSGTTGKPKAVVQHCGMFEPNVRDIIKTYGLTGEDRSLLVNRLFHVNAQVTNFFPMTLLGGTTVLAAPDPKNFLSTVARREITYSSVIPPYLKYILQHPPGTANGRKKLRFLIAGADILSPELHRKFTHQTGIQVRPGYGLTETLCWCTGSAVGEGIYWGSIGTPLTHDEIKIVDPENNWEETGVGEWGRLIVKGDNIFREYFKNPEATKKAFAPSVRWGDGWFDTGDTCKKPFKTKKVINFGWRASADSWKVRGEFVQGPDIDNFAASHPAVEDAMAIPMLIGGETETALCIVPKTEGLEATTDDANSKLENVILNYCEEGRMTGKIEKHIKIKKVIIVPKIELGDTGKKSRKKMTKIAEGSAEK